MSARDQVWTWSGTRRPHPPGDGNEPVTRPAHEPPREDRGTAADPTAASARIGVCGCASSPRPGRRRPGPRSSWRPRTTPRGAEPRGPLVAVGGGVRPGRGAGRRRPRAALHRRRAARHRARPRLRQRGAVVRGGRRSRRGRARGGRRLGPGTPAARSRGGRAAQLALGRPGGGPGGPPAGDRHRARHQRRPRRRPPARPRRRGAGRVPAPHARGGVQRRRAGPGGAQADDGGRSPGRRRPRRKLAHHPLEPR